MNIEHIDRVNGTDAVPIAVEGWHSLIQEGISTSNTVLLAWDDKAVLARINDEAVGVITYNDLEWKDTFHISLGYVKPSHRRKGVYTALFNALAEKAKEKGRKRITGLHSVKNAPMHAVSNSLGRVPTYIEYEYRV